MGTEIEIAIPRDDFFDEEKAKKATENVFLLFDKYEAIFSRFDSNSELSRLNRREITQVSEELFQLSAFAFSLAKKTDGIFNPLVNLSVLGYAHDFGLGDFSPDSSSVFLDFSTVIVDEKKKSIFLPPNAKIDLNACAKGFSVDAAVKILDAFFPHFCIGAGGDFFVRGLFHGEKWEISIANPENENEDVEVLLLSDVAVATSGSYRRHWKTGKKSFHHLVSGKTNQNLKTEIMSVSVVAKTALEADAFATTVFLMGKKQGSQFLLHNNSRGYFF